ncbi:MAG: PTS mannitol transporter subunit IICB [Sarcina sp.]
MLYTSEMNQQGDKKEKVDLKQKIQKFGRTLSGMVMPNMGAFIAWGIITALFIPTGWFPNEKLAQLVDPILKFLLPLLIGYTGGNAIYKQRGGLIGGIVTCGVIAGSDAPMFLGAMIVGPLGAVVIKKFDEIVQNRIPAGFEMLVNNFSAGIIGCFLCVVAFLGIGPAVDVLNGILQTGVQTIVDASLLPLTAIFVEPAKVLFLNNAINHGILGPIAIQEAAEFGKSIFFLLESNPGPGLGILIAYFIFGKGSAKQTSSGAMIIHFFGGIHEIYFPYILMRPILLLAAIAGGIVGTLVFTLLNVGLIATPSPGSIFAILAMTPKGGILGLLLGVLASTVVSFLVAAIFIKRDKSDENELEKAKEKMTEMKAESKGLKIENAYVGIKKIIVACDAGMGSSAMGATILRNKVKKAGLNIEVTNCPVDNIPEDAQMVFTHRSLSNRAKAKAKNAEHISIDNFIKNNEYDEVVKLLQK